MYLSSKCRSSSLICHFVFKQPRKSLKIASYLPLVQRKSDFLSKAKHELVYDFPLIKFPVALARSRYSITIGAVIITPFLFIFSSKISVVAFLLSVGVHFVMSAVSSKLSENIVGKIYVNKESNDQEVIISSIDKFGRRIDRSHKIDNFINCDYYSKYSRRFGFIRLAVENSDIHYKVNIRNCKIYSPEICSYLLGRLWTEPATKQKTEQKTFS